MSNHYQILFPNEKIKNKFKEMLSALPKEQLNKIYCEINRLSSNPRPEGKKFKFLKVPVRIYSVASQYRLRVGNYRILYDIDDKTKKVWLLAVRKRSEKTYK